MTHDLLKIAEECKDYSQNYTNLENAPHGCGLLEQAAAALREAHAEIEKLRAELEGVADWVFKNANKVDYWDSYDSSDNTTAYAISKAYTPKVDKSPEWIVRGCDSPLDAIQSALAALKEKP